jgi:hypothetical protein
MFRRNDVKISLSRRAGFLFASLIVPMAAIAIGWPVASGNPIVPFGSFHAGRFVTEMTLAPPESPVLAAADGDIAFSFDGDRLPSGLPCTLGSFIAMSYPDGLVSVYGHLERGSMPNYIRTAATGDVLGRAGNSGFYSDREASFTLYDRVKRQYLNPETLLPAVKDDKAPVVRAVFLTAGDKTYSLAETRSLRQGTYEVYADLFDPSPVPDARPRPRSPYSIRLLIDGTERLRYVYEIARAEGGSLRFFGAAKADSSSFYRPDGKVRLGSYLLSRGRSTLVLIVTDYAGNEREIASSIMVE